MIEKELKDWLAHRLATQPEYLVERMFPALDALEEKEGVALHQAMRKEDLPAIKYHMGRLDGVQLFNSLLGGLRLSDGKQPAAPGLLARMFSRGGSET